MTDYETRRLQNIKRNEALVKELGLLNDANTQNQAQPTLETENQPSTKRRKFQTNRPTRSSTRIARASKPPSHKPRTRNTPRRQRRRSDSGSDDPLALDHRSPEPQLKQDNDSLIAGWSSWTPVAPPPTRDVEGNYHFESHPLFTPNKSPEDIIREGSFGGSYWRPLYSKRLRITIEDDWKELPEAWTEGLDVSRYLTSTTYDPEINKYGVPCGQSIEEWEAAGWIAHEFDVRGWFQWYCRFWLGRRCADDERQIGRWRKCVGETGRWRRTLLKKYVQMGIRSVTDEGDDDGEGGGDVSPVVHQTCHHWAWEARQEALDRFWDEGR
ncbi:uncharacterized protein F4822DRAFT_9447 [Hypoxylon trugodes]|uniref:uncharacterized protein n=1 Tax=Hypoxylon trugodes TaxID=326681 RepID=UPI00219D802A|nr:uncharacterized protein F4822DRAFT_9447 [Hypoxylon trugodes]KAI1393356.1 hypothetical protein F4822DRAFT_9447 [Hypoxylon trugodes]